MWGPSGDGKFILAAVAAVVVTSIQLWQNYRNTPFRDGRAIAWFVAVAVLDAGVAALVLLMYPTAHVTKPSAPNLIAWVAIGLAVPLGLRTRMWPRVGLRRIQVDPGITYLYDIVRGWTFYHVDVRMSSLARQGRAREVKRIESCGWTSGPLFCLIRTTVGDLRTPTEQERKRIIASARNALGFEDEALRLEGLVNVIRREGLSSVWSDLKRRQPTAKEMTDGAAAIADVHKTPRTRRSRANRA